MRVVCALSILASACGNGGNPTPDAPGPIDGFDRNVMLTHLATQVLLPIQQAFAVEATALPGAVEAYCDALQAGNVGTTRDDAQAAWSAAIDRWQRTEAVMVGPVAMNQLALRDRINAWPLISSCSLDRDTATLALDPASYDLSTKLINARSLMSIEYLLFKTDTAHTCIAEPTGWSTLDHPLARCRLAQVLAVDVAAAAVELETAWKADGGDFVGMLSRAGEAGSGFTNAHEAINHVSDGIFYVDKFVKDMKLGESAGIVANSCGTVQEPCLSEVEFRLADRGTFAIRANLAALREVFTGTTETADGPGFDDFLIAVDHPEVAARMTQSLDTAIAKADAMPDSFLGALGSEYTSVVETHTAVRAFTEDLKSQFLTLLSLEIPNDVATDND